MINEFKIAQLLRARLQTVGGVPAIITENVTATMQPSVSYLREFCLFGETFDLALEANGMQRQDGVYQIDVCTPKGKGKFEGLAHVETLKAAFQRQPAAMTDGSLKINLEGSSTSPARIDGEHFVYSLSIRFTVIL
jgi:hypothetical protein